MTTLFKDKIVHVGELRKILTKKVDGMYFDDKTEATQYIDEIVCDLVERPMYDKCDLNFDNGGDIYDLIDNVDELRDMQNDVVSKVCEEQKLI